MDALDECFLHFDALIDLVGACDAISLAKLSQVCKSLRELCHDERLWHRCYGPTLSTVPKSATTWRERYRYAKINSNVHLH
jgi:hypothetical protein